MIYNRNDIEQAKSCCGKWQGPLSGKIKVNDNSINNSTFGKAYAGNGLETNANLDKQS